MVRRLNGRAMWLRIFAVVAAIGVALPLAAQSSTGIAKGVVKDDKGQPVENAKVSFDLQDTSRHFESKTNKKGEYAFAGLPPGDYKITAEKDKLVAVRNMPVHAAQTLTADLALAAGGGAAAGAGGAGAAMAGNAALKKSFDEGVALSNAGKYDEAIAKFNEGLAISAKCYDCYDNIGFSYLQKKDYDKAEEAYKKAIDVKADDASAYDGLANLYNAQRKFDDAAKASAKATELAGAGSPLVGGNADALFNQGVILWNGGKIPEAKKAFEAALQANPNHAEAHFQLGMALVNEGNMAGAATEFDTYLKLAPSGPNAATAKALLDQVKK
jgi:tetratricopeptide (TPR) repeat protein